MSATGSGEVVALTPGAGGKAASKKALVSGLTAPQGLAFDNIGGTEYLYVAESNQIDRYVWNSNGSLGKRTVLIKNLPDTSSTGDDVHRPKSIAIGPDHTIYVAVGSSSNATPDEAGESPPRASVLSFSPEGTEMRVFASGVRNGEGLSFAPDGTLWTAVNERDEIPYPFHGAYGEFAEAYGHVITQYVNEHPPEEVARLTAGRNLGWPYCNPDPDTKPGNPKTRMNYLKMPFDRDESTNPGGAALNCSSLAPIDVGHPRAQRSARPQLLGGVRDPGAPLAWRRARRPRLVGPHASSPARCALDAVAERQGHAREVKGHRRRIPGSVGLALGSAR